MALKLGFVLFLIYGCAYLLRRYSSQGVGEWFRPQANSGSEHASTVESKPMRVIQTQRLGPQLQLQLIEVEEQRLLLSVSSEGARLLHIFPIKEISDETGA